MCLNDGFVRGLGPSLHCSSRSGLGILLFKIIQEPYNLLDLGQSCRTGWRLWLLDQVRRSLRWAKANAFQLRRRLLFESFAIELMDQLPTCKSLTKVKLGQSLYSSTRVASQTLFGNVIVHWEGRTHTSPWVDQRLLELDLYHCPSTRCLSFSSYLVHHIVLLNRVRRYNSTAKVRPYISINSSNQVDSQILLFELETIVDLCHRLG